MFKNCQICSFGKNYQTETGEPNLFETVSAENFDFGRSLNPNLKMPLIKQPQQKRWAAGGSEAQLSSSAHFKC